MSWYTAKIDKVAQVAESSQYEDAALAAAWRDRMNRRLDHLRSITGRIAAEGRLAEGWTPGTAAELIHVVTMPGPWRELTREVEWTAETYVKHVGDMLRRSLLN
jgi:hypothetical protein